MAAEQIPGLREDAAYAVINGNNATLVDLVPYVDGLYAETADSEAAQAYVNVIVVKPKTPRPIGSRRWSRSSIPRRCTT